MKEVGRKGVDPAVVQEESKLLKSLWDSARSADRGTQAVFGEQYEIGNQSAVGQFIRGEAPLSLKAAKGFAKGLGCPISAFSKRLAAEVESANAVNAPALTRATDANWPFTTVTPDQYFEVLSQAQRDIVEAMTYSLVNSRSPPEKHPSPANMPAIRTNVAKTA